MRDMRENCEDRFSCRWFTSLSRHHPEFFFWPCPSLGSHSCRSAHTQYRKLPAKNYQRSTHTRELDATVTALGSGTLLLQVKVTELTTRGLDDANLVGPRVVPVERKKNRQ